MNCPFFDDEKIESDFTPDKLGPERYGIPRGWYQPDDDWYLTFDALMKELKMPKKKLLEILKDKKVKTQTLQNRYNSRLFTVYRALDFGIDRNPDLER